VLSVARASADLSGARDHHVTTVIESDNGPFLFVIGGTPDASFDTVQDDVQRAKIAPDGSLSGFEKQAAMPRGLAGAALAVAGDTLVMAGGIVNVPKTAYAKETLFAKIDRTSGTLGAFAKGPDLPEALMHAAAVSFGKSVYVFGGTKGSAASSMSVRFPVNDDGTLGARVDLPPLDPPRSHHVAFVWNDHVYLAGGLIKGLSGNPPSRTDVVRAQLGCDGSLGAWEPAGDLPVPLSISSAQVFGGRVYLFGGLSNEKSSEPYTDHVLRGIVNVDTLDFEVGEVDARLSAKRGHVHQTPTYKNFIYSVGGRLADGSALGNIDVGTFR
jgi:N-acetylneuraminic acid mutarotase